MLIRLFCPGEEGTALLCVKDGCIRVHDFLGNDVSETEKRTRIFRLQQALRAYRDAERPVPAGENEYTSIDLETEITFTCPSSGETFTIPLRMVVALEDGEDAKADDGNETPGQLVIAIAGDGEDDYSKPNAKGKKGGKATAEAEAPCSAAIAMAGRGGHGMKKGGKGGKADATSEGRSVAIGIGGDGGDSGSPGVGHNGGRGGDATASAEDQGGTAIAAGGFGGRAQEGEGDGGEGGKANANARGADQLDQSGVALGGTCSSDGPGEGALVEDRNGKIHPDNDRNGRAPTEFDGNHSGRGVDLRDPVITPGGDDD